MALPVWLIPAAKKAGTWLLANGPTLIEYSKKYGPPALEAFREHGLKPVKIIKHVSFEAGKKPRKAGGAGKSLAAPAISENTQTSSPEPPQT